MIQKQRQKRNARILNNGFALYPTNKKQMRIFGENNQSIRQGEGGEGGDTYRNNQMESLSGSTDNRRTALPVKHR